MSLPIGIRVVSTASFYDGHAKRYTPDTIRASKDLTGCTLVQAYPHISSPGGNDDMCDGKNPTCANNLPDNQSPNLISATRSHRL